MDLELKEKTALVTGASSVGIGRAIAKILAAEGVHLCLAARRRDLLEELAAEIAASGAKKPHVVAVDLLEKDGPSRLAAESIEALGSVGILMNCAGGGGGHFGLTASEEKWEHEFNLNFTSVRKLTLAVVPDMIKHNWGRIVSISGKLEPPRKGIMGPTGPKAALHGFSKGLSNEVGRHGITSNCLAPGKIMSEQIRRKHTSAEAEEEGLKETAVGRFGEPEELARLAVFLASPHAGYITGTVIPVDGGMRRYAF